MSFINGGEEYVDKLLENKEEKMKAGKDVTSITAFKIVKYMLNQCRLHGFELDETGISRRQKHRRLTMAMDVGDGVNNVGEAHKIREKSSGRSKTFLECATDGFNDVWEGSSGSSRTLSDGEEEGNACGMRGGNGYCTSVSEESS